MSEQCMRIRCMVMASVTAIVLAGLVGCAKPPEKPTRTEVVYFHRTIRCPSCETIEAWAKSAVAADAEAGRVTWMTLNLDEPANAQCEDKYALTAQSVVIREVRGGQETRWKNLDKVWDLLNDEGAFTNYVQEELTTFMTPRGTTQ